MDATAKLWAIEQIKQLKARYFRSMDTKDWATLEGVFALDAVMDMRRHPARRSSCVDCG